jgi:hypothetical protein
VIGYEVLTHAHHRAREMSPAEELESDEMPPLLERPKPVGQLTSQIEPFGNVIDIIVKVMAPGSGNKVEIKDAYSPRPKPRLSAR